ncbi:hypothetical protein NP233_g5445 [Leucocoprinus birnbaumii]|uniref:Methyltransferase domain-containing protein n=1 Tax=Leucocoprinus birnbaumii TaxID=56174 RepID=A0AAD5VT93_9AGAR|nr:hypothetical protein NP233_g5445 [Leucocoprinus birnbaumii]
MTTLPLNDIPPKKVYWLPSDKEERRRLNRQHRLVLSGSGGRHIHAPIDTNSIDSVLEAGTGSGIWLEEVAQQLPEKVELIGIDLSTNLFPQSPAPNVSFRKQSLLDLPREWANKFDLIHQRLLVAGLRNEEWHAALSQYYRALKPGGWVQLYEIFSWEGCGPALEKMNQMVVQLYESRGIRGTWGSDGTIFKRYAEAAGFTDIRVTWAGWLAGKWAGEEGQVGAENLVEFIKACKTPILKAGGFGMVTDSEEFDGILQEVEKELDTRSGTWHRCVIVCGRKPLQVQSRL